VTDVDERLRWCADLVEYACRDRSVCIASAYVRPDEVWLDMRRLRAAASNRARDAGVPWGGVAYPDGFGSAMMQRAAKAGLIAGRDFLREYIAGRRDWRFTTLALAAEWDTERGLTDGERAERCAAAVRVLYERDRARRGDNPALWSVSTNLAAVPQDGIDHAIDGGLVVEHHDRSLGRRLVPVDEWEAFSEALADYERRRTQAADRHAGLVDRLHEHAGGDRRRIDGLSTDQVERILTAIGEP
jgi:hypothetical protein